MSEQFEADAKLPEGFVEALRAGLRGQVLIQDDAGYDAARAVYNAMIRRRPGAIATVSPVIP
jgi:hypothetical protein